MRDFASGTTVRTVAKKLEIKHIGRGPVSSSTKMTGAGSSCAKTVQNSRDLRTPQSRRFLQIRTLPEAEIADMQKDIERQKEKAVAAVERLERLMKEMGLTDSPKTGNDNQC